MRIDHKIVTIVSMEPVVLLGYVSGVLGILTIIASGFVVVKSSATKATIETQNQLIDALVKSDKQKNELISVLQSDIDKLKGEVGLLRDMPLGEISKAIGDLAAEQKCIKKDVATAVQDHSDIIGLLNAGSKSGK